ncbi:phosphate acetyltransferase [Photobacterium sp. TY1-4]|uniref:phosphate acetyltransferase n=1 Tax=Photobacterium sp. TY1-4 TaxID=2899122 RepID=UPI0021C03FF6|nr:phosphate acetyltransferase [Photobacterium sp. TY1-4]UXI00104.1 phosphate acetyltransferase [Photobacterium sp. TY1-4]
MKAIERIIEQAKQRPVRIVLSEGDDARVLRAAVKAAQGGIAEVILVGNTPQIQARAEEEGVCIASCILIDPATSPLRPALTDMLFALRAGKGMTRTQAEQAVLDPLCYANLLVRYGAADGSVAGAVQTTANVVRSAIQVIGLAPDCRLVSSFFLMMLCEPFHDLKGGLIFSDCGLVVEPSAEELADIALSAAESARQLLMETPRVAMLSFSTSGSARHAAVDKVVAASALVKSRQPELAIDGDVQLDAAIVQDIAARKLPDSQVKGQSNVLIFPNLEAGNIGYKLAERVGRAVAIGPLLQGLAKPANDLSRGCSEQDIYHVIAVTAVQAQQQAFHHQQASHQKPAMLATVTATQSDPC